jgi:Ca2+-transporting ATPase
MAVATILVEAAYEDTTVAATMGFVLFSLFNIVLGLTSHSETETVFDRDTISDRRQLALMGLALLTTLLPTQLDFLKRMLSLTELNGNQWLIVIGLSLALILVDEVIKVFLRRRQPVMMPAPVEPRVAV